MIVDLHMMVICEECRTKFEIKDLQKRWVNNGIQEIYYSCKYCGKNYIVALTNKKIRDLQKKIKTAKDKGDIKKLNKLLERHKEEMDKLNKK
ncbi:MAG: hypothetical protein PWQ37_23 [Candidatus Petromonas sp.]|jgi:hypothetical protein|nr:hypothetical protein [Candidatus Petromonas sp.]